MNVLGIAGIELVPIFVLFPGHYVFRVWEGRDPFAIQQFGVPADMVPVQMGTHHEIDVLRSAPRRRERFQVVRIEVRKGGPVGPDLVVAATGIDQDVVASRADQIAVEAEDDRAVGRQIAFRQFPFGRGEHFVGHGGEELLGMQQGTGGFVHAVNGN